MNIIEMAEELKKGNPVMYTDGVIYRAELIDDEYQIAAQITGDSLPGSVTYILSSNYTLYEEEE